jgi:hypothetical protein
LPISAGMFGMQRTILRCPPIQRDRSASRSPAAMLITSMAPKSILSEARALRMSCGFTASTSVSQARIPASGAAPTRTE